MAAADDQIVAAQLPPVSSTSSLPSLASSRTPSSASISELDNTIPNEAQTATTTQGERMNPNTNNGTNTTNSATMKGQQYKRPFQSLTKLSTNGPFQKLQFHILTTLSVIYCLLSSTVSATTTNTQYQYHLRRHLEDNNSGDNENDGWTGEWTATDDMSFECDDDGGCIQTKPSGSDSSSNSNSMWYDNGDLLTPEQIITYVSLGALTFMTLLCCLCYPEIITVGCNKCLGRTNSRNLSDEDIENGGGDYVGGKLEDEGKKKKRRSRSSSKTRSSSRSRSGRSSSRSRSSKKRSEQKDVEMTQTQTQLV